MRKNLHQDDEYLSDVVFNTSNTREPDTRFVELEKRFINFTEQLKNKGVTRLLLWEEYKASCPDGYSYTQFCEHFSRYNKRNRATMHFDHRPGEYL